MDTKEAIRILKSKDEAVDTLIKSIAELDTVDEPEDVYVSD